MKLHEIGQFYGERKGWRMFDSQTLTPEIETYLSAEASFLGEAMQNGYRSVIEVGCGYGRYLDWALSRGYAYVGLDIVPWLVELGQLRVARARDKYPQARCGIFRHPAEAIESAVKELFADTQEHNAIIFFPFNCLGNVAQFDTVIDSLKACGLDLIISTFKTDATSTRFRKEYYGKCGYEQLNSRIMRQGLLIVSEEGFHAMAYHQDFLINALGKRGFELSKQEQSVNVGSIFHFTCGKQNDSAASKKTDKAAERSSEGIDVSIYAIENDPLAQNRISSDPGGALLSFREISMSCLPLSAERIQGESSHALETGTTLRLVLPVVPHHRSAIDKHFWYSDLVGEVESCRLTGDNQYRIIIKLSKAEPGLLEKLVRQ